MVALTMGGRIYKRHFGDSINAEKLIVGLEHIHRHLNKPFIPLDTSQAHRSNLVKKYLAEHSDIYREYLLPYAPELNTEEYYHGNVKRRIKNGIQHSKSEIRKNLDLGFARFRKRPYILLGFFQQDGLGLTQLW